MARVSRPPGFDMTYKPVKTQTFGPPALSHLPALIYLTLAVGLVAVVMIGSASSNSSWLFRYIVEEDSQRLLGARTLAVIVFVSALASLAKTRMRGVIVHPEGLETRDTLGVGWPRVRRYAWPQIDRIVLDAGRALRSTCGTAVANGSPKSARATSSPRSLERIRDGPRHPINGGAGMFDALEDVEYE